MSMGKLLVGMSLIAGTSCSANALSENANYLDDVTAPQAVARPVTGNGMLTLPMVGKKAVLLIVGQWNDADNYTAQALQEQIFSDDPRSLRSFVLAASGGKLSLDEFKTITPDFGAKPGSRCDSSDMYQRAAAAMAREGIEATDYDHYFVVVKCQGGANAAMPGNRAVFLGMGSTSHAFLHEFGHNLGGGHPFTYMDCPQNADTIFAPEGCTTSKAITDSGDPVGGGSALYPAITRAFTGWLSDQEQGEITKAGVYRLAPLGTNGPQLYTIRRPGTNEYINFEYRQANPPYDFPEDDNRNQGLWIRYSTVTTAVASLQLNANPQDTSIQTPTLLPGKQLVDQIAGVKVRTCSAGAEGVLFAVALGDDQALPDCKGPVAAPVVSIPAAGSEVMSRPVIAGTGIPGATVIVAQSYKPEVTLARTTVDARGNWRVLIDQPLPAGRLSVSAQQVLGASTSAWGNNHAVMVTSQDLGPLEILPLPVVASQLPTIRGTGTPGARVKVTHSYDPWGSVGEATVDEYGNWAVDANRMQLGRNSVSARQTLGGSQSGWAANRVFNVAAQLPTVIESLVSEAVSEATVTGTAMPDAVVVVVVANQPGNLLGYVKADVDGKWRIKLEDLPSGSLSISATSFANRIPTGWAPNKTVIVQ
jgi:hypothetical protein